MDSFKGGFKAAGKRKQLAMGGSVGRVVGSVLRPAPSPTARPAASQPGNRMIQKYADGGNVEIPRIEVTAKRMTPAEAKAYDDAQVQRQDANGNEGLGRDTSGSPNSSEAVEAARRKNVDREIHRTINGAPIRNPHPANLPVGSGGVRG